MIGTKRAKGTVWAEVIGDKHLIATMLGWGARAVAAEPAYEAMHEYLKNVERELFESEGASGAHGAWEPLKATDEPAHPILQATRNLMNSLVDESHPDHEFIMTPDGFAMGTRVPYAEEHQMGTQHVPQRRVVDLTVENRAALVMILDEYIFRAGLRPAGGGVFGFRVRGTTGRFIG